MQKYVLVYPFPTYGDDVMLIRKAKPEWQRGRLNLVGGKVEPGESFDSAAEREFREETELDGQEFRRVGTIRSDNSDFVLGVYSCWTWRENRIISEPTELVEWFKWDAVKNDPALMDNLRLVIPLIRAGMRDWTILHGRNDAGEQSCMIEWERQHAHV